MNISPIKKGSVFGIKNQTFYRNKTNNFLKNTNTDVFIFNNKKESNPVSFRGEPYKLPQPTKSAITADEAIRLYDNFKLGNYLDIDGDAKKIKAKEIREKNLSFLDKVKDNNEKRGFINGYKNLTDFPDMKMVAGNIRREFKRACRKAESESKKEFPQFAQNYDIICAGYDGISSVAKGTALPGSDLDKAYIILRGCDSDYGNEVVVNVFKERLWKNTDQRILSYNHDIDSFPKIYTLKQINTIIDSIDKTANLMDLDKKEQLPYKGFFDMLFGTPKFKTKRGEYKRITQNFQEDYIKANSFLIDIAKNYPTAHSWNAHFNPQIPWREDVYRASFVIEAMLKGTVLIGKSILNNRDTKNLELLNLSQIDAIKATNTPKEKYLIRQNLEKDFKTWSTEKQFNFIKQTIKASCSDESGFPEYFKSDTSDKFMALLKTLNVGDK